MGNMLQGIVQYTVRFRRLPDFEIPDDILILVKVG
jgi:hypothetical protein